jgi:hypothetical protein
MKVKDLKALLASTSDEDGELEVIVRLALPSMGSVAADKVTAAHFGFDWDRDLILDTESPLVPKSENQAIFENAYDLLMWLATNPAKHESYEIRRAKQILSSYGKTQEDFERLRHLFHRKSE